jgi:predicted dithiol-disulfide oxidoreductase (DUF899 family)
MTTTITKPRTSSARDQWRAARIELLKAEKEHTRRGDELAQMRQALPRVPVDKAYQFYTEQGPTTLKELFRGRSQLLVYHFMFGPDWEAGCPSCSAIADGFNGIAVHLANHDVSLTAVSRAPLDKLLRYKQRMGWTFPWASSHGGDFNNDFNVYFTEEQQRAGDIEYNYARGEHAMDATTDMPAIVTDQASSCGTSPAAYTRDRPGLSTFVLEGDQVFHTYSAYARGLDGIWGMYQWLDRAPKGRNETGLWWKRHDEYGQGGK